jgi:hypothetical protein
MRVLYRLSESGVLIALGDGPGDPLPYFIDPLMIGMMGDTPSARALYATLEAEVAKISGEGRGKSEGARESMSGPAV